MAPSARAVVPPIAPAFSSTTTEDAPFSSAEYAAVRPLPPPPHTITSYSPSQEEGTAAPPAEEDEEGSPEALRRAASQPCGSHARKAHCRCGHKVTTRQTLRLHGIILSRCAVGALSHIHRTIVQTLLHGTPLTLSICTDRRASPGIYLLERIRCARRRRRPVSHPPPCGPFMIRSIETTKNALNSSNPSCEPSVSYRGTNDDRPDGKDE